MCLYTFHALNYLTGKYLLTFHLLHVLTNYHFDKTESNPYRFYVDMKYSDLHRLLKVVY